MSLSTPDISKPKTVEDYVQWLREKHSVVINSQSRKYFETVIAKLCHDFQHTPFWTAISDHKKHRDYDEEYRKQHDNYGLLITETAPTILVKSFESFLLKTFRLNVLQNENWPAPPAWAGHSPTWHLPTNWLTRANDLVRTCFVVKYLDGIQFLITHLSTLAREHNLESRSYLVAEGDGYYAAHLYLRSTYEVPRLSWDTEKLSVEVEVQVTTQLQDVIKRLLHTCYEDRRKSLRETEERWRWDSKSMEFCTSYLGHMLHYAEGMIVEVRDRQKEKTQ